LANRPIHRSGFESGGIQSQPDELRRDLLETVFMEIGGHDAAGLANGFEQLSGLASAPGTRIQHAFAGLGVQQQTNQLCAFLLNRKRTVFVTGKRAWITRATDPQAERRKRSMGNQRIGLRCNDRLDDRVSVGVRASA
jgi:hypothetical protein